MKQYAVLTLLAACAWQKDPHFTEYVDASAAVDVGVAEAPAVALPEPVDASAPVKVDAGHSAPVVDAGMPSDAGVDAGVGPSKVRKWRRWCRHRKCRKWKRCVKRRYWH